MEDFLQIQEQKNYEFKQKKRAELKTPEGFRKAIGEKVGSFINKLMLKKNYQAVFGIVLAYIVFSGLWFIFSHLFSINTVVVIGLCLLFVYWSYLLAFIHSIKKIYNGFISMSLLVKRLVYTKLKLFIYGCFKRKK